MRPERSESSWSESLSSLRGLASGGNDGGGDILRGGTNDEVGNECGASRSVGGEGSGVCWAVLCPEVRWGIRDEPASGSGAMVFTTSSVMVISDMIEE